MHNYTAAICIPADEMQHVMTIRCCFIILPSPCVVLLEPG